MISTIALMLSHPRRAVMVVLGLGAVAGCSIFAASGRSAARNEPAVPEQVTSSQASDSRRTRLHAWLRTELRYYRSRLRPGLR